MTSRFEILIKPNINGTFSSVTYNLDTYDSIPLTFNYAIADIKDISKRNSAMSLTITIPETANNRYIFQQIGALDVNSTFNPNLNSACEILVDSISVMEGYLCLTDINYDYNNNFTEYNCTIIADNGNFWVDVGEGFLQDLDLSRYDHRWNYENIVSSWCVNGSTATPIPSNPIPRDYRWGYFYPLIDYDNGWTLPFLQGGLTFSYVFSTIYDQGAPVSSSYSVVQSQVTIGDMFPAIYVKTVWDEIFNEIGYQYQSTFLNDTMFESLIMPFTNGNLTSFSSGTQSFTFSVTTSGTFSVYGYSQSIVPLDTIIYDPSGFWNTSTFVYTNVTPEIFNQFFEISLQFKAAYIGGQLTTYVQAFRERNPQGGIDATWASGDGYPLNIFNGSNAIYYHTYSYLLQSWNFITGALDGSTLYNQPIAPGESFRIKVGFLSATTNPEVFYNFTLSSQLVTGQLGVLNITPGEIFNISQSLPLNFKKKDFLMSIIRMFNLYIEPVKGQRNMLRIEPRDTYYSTGQVLDWTDKLDLSQPINSMMLSNTQDRVTLFSYTADNDYFNEDFKNRTNQVYGQFKYITDNQFSQSEGKIETKFAPLPISEIFQINNNFYYQTPFVIPRIGKYTNVTNNNEQFSRTAVKPRIAFRGILPALSFTSSGTYSYTNSWLLQSDATQAGLTPSQINGLPSCWHFDDPFEPSYDLNFGYGSSLGVGYGVQLFYPLPVGNWTNNNLYNLYYDNQMTQITDTNARMLTCQIYLTPEDIQSFYFNSSIYLEVQGVGQYYYVNAIKGYDPTTIKTTTVELLKLNGIKHV
jgi:hypothetical protein